MFLNAYEFLNVNTLGGILFGGYIFGELNKGSFYISM
jgi:hypothetical protein